jgi:putative peptidoglycan lipid II flippase
MRVAIATVVVNIVLIVVLVWPLWQAQHPAAHAGIALATALAGIVNAVLLAVALRRQGLLKLQPGWLVYLLRLSTAVVAMGVLVGWMQGLAGDWNALTAWQRVAWLAAVVASGGALYGLALLVLGLRPQHLREPA